MTHKAKRLISHETFVMPINCNLLPTDFNDLEKRGLSTFYRSIQFESSQTTIILNMLSFKFQPNNPNQIARSNLIGMSSIFAMQFDFGKREKISQEILDKYYSKQPINGYEVLNLKTLKKAWIHHIDMGVLQKRLRDKDSSVLTPTIY